ncbi:MAG TPA: tyrosine--tRNA ligase [Candidatus Paceibacterota bacterium]|nr:tyrosine--tRNA ligase [Candidatus Paceibacterota bacterium]
MTLAQELKERGLIVDTSAPPEKIFAARRTVYLGIDPTADSMHAGHLVPILLMRRLGEAGNKLIFLVGGGTGLVGDPKEAGERPMLDAKTVAANTRALKRQLKGLMNGIPFTMADNADWLAKLKLLPFLREIGKHFTVNDLVKRDIIKKRLETPDESISYTEFTYALLQGYDFLTLNEKYGCDLQVGASDQWTNMLSGVELIRKKAGREAFAFTVPLITDANGKKFGKSEGNAVWLDARKTSPFRFYQFWMNLPDTNVEQYLKVYTFMPLAEIQALMELHRRSPGERQAQETLARLVTELVHGPAATAQAAAATDALFGGVPFANLSNEAREVVLAEAPSVTLSKKEIADGVPLADILISGGLASSRSDSRRLVEGKGVTVNGMVPQAPDQKVYAGDLPGGHALVRKGKQGVLILVLK